MLKRLFDITSSGAGLLVLSPILLVVMVILKFSGEGEIFFFQKRMGYKNEPFNITKFATMLKSAAVQKAGDYTVKNDPRVLPVGRFLRKTKLNELVQLWDVVRGKMSIVGPRPQVLRVHAQYPPSYAAVFEKIRPGITGVASIVFRDEEQILTDAKDREYCYTQQIIPYKVELETWYANNQSFLLDMKLIFLTIWYVLKPDSRAMLNILPENLHRDMSSFDGVVPSAS